MPRKGGKILRYTTKETLIFMFSLIKEGKNILINLKKDKCTDTLRNNQIRHNSKVKCLEKYHKRHKNNRTNLPTDKIYTEEFTQITLEKQFKTKIS